MKNPLVRLAAGSAALLSIGAPPLRAAPETDRATFAEPSAGARPALDSLRTQAEQAGVDFETVAAPALPAATRVAQLEETPPMSCLREATGPLNDPQGLKRDFTALGRCKTVTSWEDPRATKPVRQWQAGLCIGRYLDPADDKRVYLLWGNVEGRYDDSSGLSLPIPKIAAVEGGFESTGPDRITLRLTAEETEDSITLRKTVDFPSANLDPNKAFNDQDGLVRFSKGALRLAIEMRWRGNYPFSVGRSWSAPAKLALSCEREEAR